MPTYEYKCSQCARQFDVRQSYDSAPVASCPHCGGEARRVLQSPFIVYKASGFYTSDQRRNGRGNYWYNRERKEDQTGVKEAGGGAEPPPTAPTPSPAPSSPDPSD